jgi:hypothetical protein
MQKFLEFLVRIDGQTCSIYVRNLLRFLCENRMINHINSVSVFKLFLMKGVDNLGLNMDASVVLTMFELALFSKSVIKEMKSATIM